MGQVVLIFGDSIALGTGDMRGVGWPGRLATYSPGTSPTVYNLGVASDTTVEIARRWKSEAEVRVKPADDCTVVFAFGLNDATLEDARNRVPMEQCLDLASGMLRAAGSLGDVLWIGPTAVDESTQPRRVSSGELREKRNREIERYDDAFANLAKRISVPYLQLFPILMAEKGWSTKLADGVHPDADGHDRLASLITGWPAWRSVVSA